MARIFTPNVVNLTEGNDAWPSFLDNAATTFFSIISFGAANPTQPDVVYAKGGNDTVSTSGADDTVYGGDGNDVVSGGDDQDLLFGEAGADVLHGDAGADSVMGGEGDDTLNGDDYRFRTDLGDFGRPATGTTISLDFRNSGNDTLEGEAGNDLLEGFAGADQIEGGTGNDVLYPAAKLISEADGAQDRLIFWNDSGQDTVYGFAQGEDLIEVVNYAIFGLMDFDTNDDGVLDAMRLVEEGLLLDFGAAEGGPAGVNTVLLVGQTSLLTSADIAFAGILN